MWLKDIEEMPMWNELATLKAQVASFRNDAPSCDFTSCSDQLRFYHKQMKSYLGPFKTEELVAKVVVFWNSLYESEQCKVKENLNSFLT